MNAKVSEMILAQAQKIGALKHQLEKIEKSLQEKATLLTDNLDNEELKTEVDTLTDQVEKMRAELVSEESRQNTLIDIEKLSAKNAEKTEPVTKAGAPAYIHKAKTPDKPHSLIFKSAAAEFIAYVKRRPVEDVLKQYFPNDDTLKTFNAYAQKTAVDAANTFTDGWAKELTGEATMSLLDTLTDVSVGASLTQYAQTLNFNGASVVKVPSIVPRDPSLITEPGWVGEGGEIPLATFSFSSSSISAQKLAAIAIATEELVKSAITDIISLFQREMSKDYAVRLDASLISSAVGSTHRPAGLLQGYSALTPTAGGGVNAVIGDVTALANALTVNNMGGNPILIINRLDYNAAMAMRSDLGAFQFADELRQGRLMGYPVVVSNSVPQHMAIMLDPSSLALAFDGPETMVSREATIVHASADGVSPTHATDAGGTDLGTAGEVPRNSGLFPSVDQAGLGTAIAGGVLVSNMFQRYCVAVRSIFPTSFARLRPNMLAFMSATTWTA